jgi:hypothetical protein
LAVWLLARAHQPRPSNAIDLTYIVREFGGMVWRSTYDTAVYIVHNLCGTAVVGYGAIQTSLIEQIMLFEATRV